MELQMEENKKKNKDVSEHEKTHLKQAHNLCMSLLGFLYLSKIKLPSCLYMSTGFSLFSPAFLS